MTQEDNKETLSKEDRKLYDAVFGPALEGWYHGGESGAWEVVGKYAKLPVKNPGNGLEYTKLMLSPIVRMAVKDAGKKVKDIGELLDKITQEIKQ